MFGDVAIKDTIGNCCNVLKGTNITRKEVVEGSIPVVAGGIQPSCYHNQSNRSGDVITVSASGANAGYINYWSAPIFASDCITIAAKNNKKLYNIYLYYSLRNMQEDLLKLQRGAGQPHVYAKDLEKLNISIPDENVQMIFVEYVKQCDKLKFEAQEKLAELQEKCKNIVKRKILLKF